MTSRRDDKQGDDALRAARGNRKTDQSMRATEFDDPGFIERLRQGEAAAYRALVRRFHASLVRFATSIIGSHAQAEEVVQDSWIAVYSGVGRFEGRSSLVTWIFSIVMNRARTRVSREGRTVGLGALMEGTSPSDRGVPLSEFRPDGHWVEVPRLWDELNPERIVGGRQLWDHVQTVIDGLPSGQKAVILLRDMEGRDAEETCELLEISAENQRVLLHRARSRIREEIDILIGARPAPGVATTRPARRTRGLGGITDGVARGFLDWLVHGGAGLTRVLNPIRMAPISVR
jgi:RNA polymerase sigma factor (sigma-70 family)